MNYKNWNRKLEYIKVNLFITKKVLIEYKVNLYSSIFEQIFYAGTILILYKVIFQNFSDIISWNFIDFFLFFLFLDGIRAFCGLFIWKYVEGGSLSRYLLSGDFNVILFKPMNSFLGYYGKDLSTNAFFYIICNSLIILFIIIWFFDLFFNLFLSLIVLILIITMAFFWKTFLASFAFKFKGIDGFLGNNVDYGVNDFFEKYPTPFFKLNFSTLYFLILPNFFIGSLLIPLLRNYEIWQFELQLFILIFMISVFSFGTYLNWKSGLKNYEAFG